MNFITRTLAIVAIATLTLGSTAAQAQSNDDLERWTGFLTLIDRYMSLIESTHAVNQNPEKSALMQMQKIQELYEQKGKKVRSVDILKGVLEKSDNQTIRNGAYHLISDTLKDAGRHDEAIKLLQDALAENMEAAR